MTESRVEKKEAVIDGSLWMDRALMELQKVEEEVSRGKIHIPLRTT